MRVSRAAKAESRDRIVAAAARRLRAAGVEGSSVGDMMADAGMTHGGFYRHFANKDALVAAAIAAAFAEFSEPLAAGVAAGEAPAAAADFVARYLGDGHVAHPELGCPVPATAADIARSGDAARAAFGAGATAVVDALAAALTGPRRRERAWRQFAMLAGAVLIARASDPATAAEVLATARRGSL
ncbi:hypothetical protein IP88_09140 [alpha proteobacterium AAP81b]|nr:hypothetical protein IP88_09140 [alpha proteobacterium AAP81b]